MSYLQKELKKEFDLYKSTITDPNSWVYSVNLSRMYFINKTTSINPKHKIICTYNFISYDINSTKESTYSFATNF